MKMRLYGLKLKQAAKVFWRQLMCAASAMGLKQSTADPCLYYKWVDGRLDMMSHGSMIKLSSEKKATS